VEVHCADSFSDGALREAWSQILCRTPGANPQMTHEWLSTCWEAFGDKRRLSLITVTDGGRIKGIAPLAVVPVGGKAGIRLNKLTFVGDGLTDYQDLLATDEAREQVLRTLLRFVIDGNDGWDAIHFRNIRGDSPNLPILRDILKGTSLPFVERVNIQSPYISIDRNWADYYGSLGQNVRSDVRRRANGLARLGKAEFVRLHEVDDVDDTLKTIRSIHVKCREALGGTSWYADDRRFRFASLILKRFGDRKWLDVVFLKLDGKVIAYYLGFAYGNVVYFWNTGYDPEFSRVSPGKLLLHYWIQDSFAAGCREFDFMVGEEPYKLQWTNTVRPNHELFVFKHTARSRLLKCYYVVKPVLKRNRYLTKIGAGIRSRTKD
jgi:CelD/BcsL family acetyltransferase involved in cellulose biosynthesis